MQPASPVYHELPHQADLLKTPIVRGKDVAAAARERQSVLLKDRTTYVAEAYKFDMDVLLATRLSAIAEQHLCASGDGSLTADNGDGDGYAIVGSAAGCGTRARLRFADAIVAAAAPLVNPILVNARAPLRVFISGPRCCGKSTALAVVASRLLFPQIADLGRWDELFVIPVDWSVLLGSGTADVAVFFCKFAHHVHDCLLPHRPSLRVHMPLMIGFWKKCVTQRDAPNIPVALAKELDDGDALQWRMLAAKLHKSYGEHDMRFFMEGVFALPGVLRDTFGFQNILYVADNLDCVRSKSALRDWRYDDEERGDGAVASPPVAQRTSESLVRAPSSMAPESDSAAADPLDLRAAIIGHWLEPKVSFVATLAAEIVPPQFAGATHTTATRLLPLRGLVKPQDLLAIGLPRTIVCGAPQAQFRRDGAANDETGSTPPKPAAATTPLAPHVREAHVFKASVFGGFPGFLAKYADLVDELRRANIFGAAALGDTVHLNDSTVAGLLRRLSDALVVSSPETLA